MFLIWYYDTTGRDRTKGHCYFYKSRAIMSIIYYSEWKKTLHVQPFHMHHLYLSKNNDVFYRNCLFMLIIDSCCCWVTTSTSTSTSTITRCQHRWRPFVFFCVPFVVFVHEAKAKTKAPSSVDKLLLLSSVAPPVLQLDACLLIPPT